MSKSALLNNSAGGICIGKSSLRAWFHGSAQILLHIIAADTAAHYLNESYWVGVLLKRLCETTLQQQLQSGSLITKDSEDTAPLCEDTVWRMII